MAARGKDDGKDADECNTGENPIAGDNNALMAMRDSRILLECILVMVGGRRLGFSIFTCQKSSVCHKPSFPRDRQHLPVPGWENSQHNRAHPTMVQIHRSNMPRRLRGPAGTGGINIPYPSRLSSADRVLLLIGVGLFCVASFSYFFLISGILGIGGPSSSSSSYDPRLSPELRKTGLSEEALLRRGGGRRISIGPNKLLDSNENAMALDIASTLHCDALQEEMEREWQTILDERKVHKTTKISNLVKKSNTSVKSWEAGAADDYAGELAREIQSRNGEGGGVHGDDFFPIEPSDKQHRRLLDKYGYGYDKLYNQDGLKLTGRHLFCLAAEALTLPKKISSDSSSSNPPTIHCDINSSETREGLLNLWSSARSQMPEDVITKTLRVILEHKETLRGHEVNLWYPENDQGTEGMLRVLNSGFEGRETYNFDTEPADKSHDHLYRFHDCKSNSVFCSTIKNEYPHFDSHEHYVT